MTVMRGPRRKKNWKSWHFQASIRLLKGRNERRQTDLKDGTETHEYDLGERVKVRDEEGEMEGKEKKYI